MADDQQTQQTQHPPQPQPTDDQYTKFGGGLGDLLRKSDPTTSKEGKAKAAAATNLNNEQVIEHMVAATRDTEGRDQGSYYFSLYPPIVSREFSDAMHEAIRKHNVSENLTFIDGNFKMQENDWLGLVALAKDLRTNILKGSSPESLAMLNGGQFLNGNATDYTDEELAAYLGATMAASNVHEIYDNPGVHTSRDDKHVEVVIDGLITKRDIANTKESPEMVARIAQQILGDNTKVYETGNLTPTNTRAADADFVEKEQDTNHSSVRC